jgi:nucleoside-diphosphate-sugar epimerase
VLGLARSDEAAARMREWGIEPILGDLSQSETLAQATSRTDATVFAPSVGPAEAAAVAELLEILEGSAKAFVFCSGTGVLSQRTLGEWSPTTVSDFDEFEPLPQLVDRVAVENLVKAAHHRGIRGIVVRPPAVWTHDQPHMLFTHVVDAVASEGAACYIGRGLNMYSNVHAEDLGEVFRAAVERGAAGATYHAVAGEVPNRWIAEVVGRHLGVPTRSISTDEAIRIWGKFYALIVASVCSRSRSPRTARDLGWHPRHVDMLESAEAWLERRQVPDESYR